MNKLKNVITTVFFVVFILAFSAACLLKPAQEKSEAERRPLAQMPEITWNSIKKGFFFDDFEKYTVDQFPLRDFFRGVKARIHMNVLNIKENNDLAVEDGYIAKVETEVNKQSLENAAAKFEYIIENYLKDANTNNYLAIVPDKNYYFGPAYGYPTMDYEEMVRFVQDALPGFTYVDLFNVLTLSDYYKTDTHWSQDRLENVVKALSEAMGFEKKLNKQYQISQFDEFKGVYYGQSALNPDKDTIYYLSDEIIKSCTVFDYNSGKKMRMYNLSALGGSDAYDVFLSGPQPLLRIDNPNATTNKQLILFRDSYGSSLAPLLAEGYSSIFVVDIRYISPSELGKYIRFDGQDVLFLYSTMILNDSFSFLS